MMEKYQARYEITNWGGEVMGSFLTSEGGKAWLLSYGTRGDALWDNESDSDEPIAEVF